MVWNKGLPLGTTPIKNSDQMIRDNWDAIEDGLVPYAKLRLDEQAGDPANITDTVQLYSKQVDSVTRFFCEEEDGTVIQITEGGALPLSEISADPTNAANKGFLYTKVVATKTELFWEDEDGNVLQITSGGTFNAASKAEMETGTDLVKVVTAGRVKSSEGVAKFSVLFDGTGAVGAITPDSSYNIASVTKNGTADYTIVFTTAFSSEDYYIFCTGALSNGNAITVNPARLATPTPLLAGSVRIQTFNQAAALEDSLLISVVGFGQQ